MIGTEQILIIIGGGFLGAIIGRLIAIALIKLYQELTK